MKANQMFLFPVLGLGAVCVAAAGQMVLFKEIEPRASLAAVLASLGAAVALLEALVWWRNRGASGSCRELALLWKLGLQRASVVAAMDATHEPMALLRVAACRPGMAGCGLERTKVLYTNARWAALLGVSPRELRGRHLSEWVRIKDENFPSPMSSCPRDCCGEPFTVEWSHYLRDASPQLQLKWIRLDGENFYLARLTPPSRPQVRDEESPETPDEVRAAWNRAA